MTAERTWLTKALEELGAKKGVTMLHREGLARISDRYQWGHRDSDIAPRQWTEAEAYAIVEVVRLRNLGFEWELIDRLVDSGPESVLTEVEAALAVINRVATAA